MKDTYTITYEDIGENEYVYHTEIFRNEKALENKLYQLFELDPNVTNHHFIISTIIGTVYWNGSMYTSCKRNGLCTGLKIECR